MDQEGRYRYFCMVHPQMTRMLRSRSMKALSPKESEHEKEFSSSFERCTSLRSLPTGSSPWATPGFSAQSRGLHSYCRTGSRAKGA